MGDYGGGHQATSINGGHWPLVIGAALVIAAIYVVFPTSDAGPKSVTVVGVSAPRPAFGSYPGLRVPVTRRPDVVSDNRT
jgi:hypothetical protein